MSERNCRACKKGPCNLMDDYAALGRTKEEASNALKGQPRVDALFEISLDENELNNTAREIDCKIFGKPTS